MIVKDMMKKLCVFPYLNLGLGWVFGPLLRVVAENINPESKLVPSRSGATVSEIQTVEEKRRRTRLFPKN